MSIYHVHVNHGSQHVATVQVLAADRFHAIAEAVSTVRVRKSLPVQYSLLGTIAR